MARLTELGLKPEEQRTIGCAAESATCAQVENVLAAIPGRTADTIVLMAHYDSVPNAPGAGDDGAAVAALLEMTRIVKAGAPYRNTILLVFTDAEETGLLGAEAFFAESPAAKRVKAVINLEGSGSAGPVYLLRTGPASGELMAAFRDAAPYPFAQSFTEEIFKRMPNDTDFSVSLRAGLPGIDFAFAGERNHYHTPLDTIANLEPGTLQHHGENTLPLLRTLVDADLAATAPNEVYASLGERHWLHWSPANGHRAGGDRRGAASLCNLARASTAATPARRGRPWHRHADRRRRPDARSALAGRPRGWSASRLAREPLALASCTLFPAAARRRARRPGCCAPCRDLGHVARRMVDLVARHAGDGCISAAGRVPLHSGRTGRRRRDCSGHAGRASRLTDPRRHGSLRFADRRRLVPAPDWHT